MQRFDHETQDQISKVLRTSAAESKLSVSAETEDTRKIICNKHEKFREQVRKGTIGKLLNFRSCI